MRSFTLVFSLLISLNLFAQNGFNKVTPRLNNLFLSGSDTDEHLVWIFFKDKGENLSHYFENPESVVSERSLKRRSKVLPQGELITMLDIPVNQEYIKDLVKKGFRVKHVSKWFNGVSGYLNRSEVGVISELSSVLRMDIVNKYKKRDPVINDYNYSPVIELNIQPEITHLLDYGPSITQLNQIRVPDVHDMGYAGEGILICSMDAGFDNLAHEVFDSMNIVDMWDFVDNDPDPSQIGTHGTKTLSMIGGFKEGQLIGPAFNADFLLARTENDENGVETPVEEDNWIAALEWADDKGVDVITSSVSYLVYDPPFESYTWQDMDGNTALITIAADLAVKRGIVVVNSAGNEGYNSNHNTLNAPADGDSVIAVGSVGSDGLRSNFSSVGPTADGRIKPDLMAMGSGGIYYATSTSTSSYGSSSVGTSFSAPLVAGVAALLLSVDSTLTPVELLNFLKQTASRSTNPNNLYGWGIVNTLSAFNLINAGGELTSFNVTHLNGEVTLIWTTSSEVNIDNFEIQRRIITINDTTDWQSIGNIPGTGSGTEGSTYTFTDDISAITAEVIEYRLKLNDFVGGFKLSNVTNVLIPKSFQLFQNYPNPFNSMTLIKYNIHQPSRVKISVYDILGNEIETLFEGIKQAGENVIQFNAGNRSSGVYFISLQAGDFYKTIKATLIK